MEHQEVYDEHHKLLIQLNTKMDEVFRTQTTLDLKIDKLAEANKVGISSLRSEMVNLVTKEIGDVEKRTEANAKAIQDILVSVGRLEVKSGVWGAVGGVIAVIAIILVGLLKG